MELNYNIEFDYLFYEILKTYALLFILTFLFFIAASIFIKVYSHYYSSSQFNSNRYFIKSLGVNPDQRYYNLLQIRKLNHLIIFIQYILYFVFFLIMGPVYEMSFIIFSILGLIYFPIFSTGISWFTYYRKVNRVTFTHNKNNKVLLDFSMKSFVLAYYGGIILGLINWLYYKKHKELFIEK